MKIRDWLIELIRKLLGAMPVPAPLPEPEPAPTPVPPTPAPEPIPEPEPSGPTLVKVWAQKNKVIGFTVTGLDGWPSKTEGGKTIIGIMRCNGKKFDFVSTANAKGGGKVVDNLYGAEYGQSIAKGQTVQIDICDLNKKKATNSLPFVWPWEGTGR